MNEYWVGVFSGFVSATILFIVLLFIIDGNNSKLRQEMQEMKAVQKELIVSVSEHEQVMRTYEFFNTTWTAQMRGEE